MSGFLCVLIAPGCSARWATRASSGFGAVSKAANFITELHLESTLFAAASSRAGQGTERAAASDRAGQERARAAARFVPGKVSQELRPRYVPDKERH